MTNKKAVLSLSGGMDSSTLLLHLLAKGYEVTALSFDYGQKHKVELERATSLVQYINSMSDLRTGSTSYEKVVHQVIKLNGLSELLNSALVSGGQDVPEGHYEQDNMKETVVPNRNKIFSSIIQAVALSLATRDLGGGQLEKRDVLIAMGIHAGDHCFSKDTNILTPDGLKTVEELQEGDSIFSFNLEANVWELDKVSAIVKKNVVDALLRIKTVAGHLDVTDEHKVYKLKLSEFNPVYGYKKEIEKVKASELTEDDFLVQPVNLPSVQQSAEEFYLLDLKPIVDGIIPKYEGGLTLREEGEYLWLGGDSEKYKSNKLKRKVRADLFIALLAWYIGEGWSQKDPYTVSKSSSRYKACFSQSLKANLEKVELIKSIIEEGEFPVKYNFSKIFYNNIPKEVTFCTFNILSMLLKEAGANSHVKHIPEWAYTLLLQNNSLREVFLYNLGLADGFNTDENLKGFCTISETLLKQVITLVQLSGYAFSVSDNPKIATKYIHYSKPGRKSAAVSLGDAKFTAIRSITSIDYNDHVYDITVERNHNFAAGEFGSLLISNSIYPDCRQEFRDIDMEAFRVGNWDSDLVQMYTPYLEGSKLDILKDGAACCSTLGLEFDEVYRRTNTSYKPIWIPVQKLSGISGTWYSDYKSAASVERIEAFINLGRPDPVEYADETGPVTWEVAKAHAEKVLAEYKENESESLESLRKDLIFDSDIEFV